MTTDEPELMIGGTKTSGQGRRRRRSNFLFSLSQLLYALSFFLLSLLLLLYALSFFLPTFDIVIEGKRSTSYGYEAFLIGLTSPFLYGGLRLFAPWLANLVVWSGLIGFVRGRFGRAFIAGLVATTLAATLLFGECDPSLLLVGYYLWLLSMGILTLAAACRLVELWCWPP
jgi:hypothetical protein